MIEPIEIKNVHSTVSKTIIRLICVRCALRGYYKHEEEEVV